MGVMRNMVVVISCLVLLGFSGVTQAASKKKARSAPVKLQTFRWRQFSMSYPSNWKIVSDNKNKSQNMIRLENQGERPIYIVMTLIANVADFTKKYREKQNLAAFTYGFSGLRHLLKSKAERTTVALNEVQIGRYTGYGAMLMSPTGKNNKFFAAQSFALIKNKLSVAGMVLTEGVQGQIFTQDEYYQQIKQAYAVLKSIKINRR